jgi:hypothetical protein
MCAKRVQQTLSGSTSSAAASPVRISLTPERAQAWLARAAAYGSSSRGSLASWDRESLSWRTSQRCLLGGWETYSGRFPTSGTMQSGRLYALPTLALRTSGSGCSSWPTPDAAASNDGENLANWQARREALKATGVNGNGCGTPLAIAARLWLTPTLGDSKASGSAAYSTESGRHSGTTLTGATVRRTWATPTSRDPKGQDLPSRRGGPSLPAQAAGKLNADWVEQLMGFPPGWTDVGPPAHAKRNTRGKRRAQSKTQARTEPHD